MPVIMNKWVEKERKRRATETAPAFVSNPIDEWLPVDIDKPIKRHTQASRSGLTKTLRGIRK